MKIFIWGTGKIAEEVLNKCNVFEIYDVLGFIDNNSQKNGSFFYGKRVFSSDILKELNADKIVVLSNYFNEINLQVKEMFPDMNIVIEDKNFFYKQILWGQYKHVYDPEIKKILEYIEKNDLENFNYDFIKKYKNLEIDIDYDFNCKMFYVYHEKRKLYFAKFLDTEQKVKNYYTGLLMEQDYESPHRYLSPEFGINPGDIVVDAGAAEGIFSLEIIEEASKIYLIEVDNDWIEALRETFKDFSDKVIIMQRFITSINEGKSATLDHLIKDNVNFIKMDIEGNEEDALLGAEKLIRESGQLKCAICSYHSNYSEVLIKGILNSYGLTCSTTPGYMWWISSRSRLSYISTKLRRGIVRGVK